MSIKKYIILVLLICVIGVAAFAGRKIINSQQSLSEIENYDRFAWNQHYANNTIKDSYKFVIVGPELTPNGRIVSDESLILRIVRTAPKIGWQVKYYDNLMGREDEIEAFNPDFIITTIPKWNIASLRPLPYKIYSFIPVHRAAFFSTKKTTLKTSYKYNGVYPHIFTLSDGLIITDKSFLLFKELFEGLSKNNFQGMVGYPGVDYFEYDDSVVADKMIYYGINWDTRRSSPTYLSLYDKLATKNIIDYYGPFIGWINSYRNGWKGFVTLRSNNDVDGQPIIDKNDAVLDLIKKYGIVLILHSDYHFDDDLPSLREFEAAAASSIIISDELEFVRKTFGDSVLYIEVKNKSAEEIESQILKHYAWIKRNPDKVKIMTKKAHDIYKKNFTLEKLLKDIAHMHESVIRDNKVDDSLAAKDLKFKSHAKGLNNFNMPSKNASY